MGKERVTPEVTRDSEGNETQAIYITEADYQRLDGEESGEPWYKHTKYSKVPTERFCFKTMAPKVALSNGVFDPALSNPDEIVEFCERVSVKEIKKTEKETAKLEPKKLVLKRGQTVWIAVHGAGVTSYEDARVESVSKKKGVFYLDNGPGNDPTGPFDIKTGKNLYEAFPGFSFNILTEKPADYDKGGHEGY